MDNCSNNININNNAKKQEYMEYLCKSGIVDKISEILIKMMLLKDKPKDPIKFLRQELDVKVDRDNDIQHLERMVEMERCEVQRLEGIVQNLAKKNPFVIPQTEYKKPFEFMEAEITIKKEKLDESEN